MASSATVFDTDTKLMLHMDGTDTSTTFTNSATNSGTVSATANGNAQIDTAQSKFGGASGLFDGTGDYLDITSSTDFDCGSGDFTIDFWFRWHDTSDNVYYVWDSGLDANKGIAIAIAPNSSNYLVVYINGSTIINNATFGGTIDAWNHVAITRTGGKIRAFRGGTKIAEVNDSTTFTANSAARVGLRINGSNGLNGWLDEFRFVKGTAVWTADFTPPSSAYSAPSPRSQIIWID